MTPRYAETVEEAAQIARVALPWISERQLPASPTNYAVAYELLSGRNSEFCATAQRSLASPPTQELMDELFRKLLSGEAQDAVVASVRDELSRIFMGALSALSAGGEGLARFKQRLLYATEQLSTNPDLGAIRGVISEMVAETRRMQAAGEEMSAQLETTCGQLEALRGEFQQAPNAVTTDPLTGALNQRGLNRELETLLNQADEHTELTLLVLDVDRFTAFNDKYGHVIGDEVLRYVARVVGKNTRGGDLLARYGADGFVVLLPDTSDGNGLHVARNIGAAVRSAGLTHKSSGTKLDAVTVSIGVVEYRHGDSAAALLARGERALGQAREAGRGQVAGDAGVAAD